MAKDVFRFLAHDESLNDYGFWAPLSGMDTGYFEKNSSLLDAHNWGVQGKCNSATAVIGKWVDIEKKDGKLFMTALFDEKDETALKIKSKVEQGMLKAVSVGFDVLEVSSDVSWMKPGQTRPTPIKTELFEVSIVPFGANKNALRLRKQGQLVTLNSGGDTDFLNILLPNIPSKKAMKELLKKLGLAEDATEQQAIEALEKLQKNRVDSLIQLGKSKGVITDKNEATFRQFATNDFVGTEQLLANSDAPAKTVEATTNVVEPVKQQSLVDVIAELTKANGKTDDNDRSKWNFNDWQTKDKVGLEKMRVSEYVKYEALAKAYTGKK